MLKKLCVSSVGKPISDLANELEVNAKTIRRDLAEQASELPQIAMLQSQQRFALPTYHSL